MKKLDVERIGRRLKVACSVCGGVAWVDIGNRHQQSFFCSAECRKKAMSAKFNKRVECVCEVCGKSFTLPAAWIRKGGGRTCSGACRGISQRKRTDVPCPVCGKLFRPTNASRLYCSRACYNAATGKQPTLRKICIHCGTAFTCQVQHDQSRDFCSLACKTACRVVAKGRSCLRCGQTFIPKREDIRYCSEECRRPPHVVACLTCGKSFRVSPALLGLNRFCSRRCYMAYDGPTVPECRAAEALTRIGVTFEREALLKGTLFKCDFLVASYGLVIEIDHPYWHSATAQKDARKDAASRALGYRVARIHADLLSGPAVTDAMLELMRSTLVYADKRSVVSQR